MSTERPVAAEIPDWKIYLVILLGLLLHSPSLDFGFFADDYVHQTILSGQLQHPWLRPWNLFDFGQYQDFQPRMQIEGGLPWWTEMDWKVRFFRPLSSASLWLDYVVYGNWTVGYHLTSLFLFALLIRLLYPLYRSWGLGPQAAAASLLVFVCLDDNLTPVIWAANRNTLLTTLFLVITALLMDRARRGANWALPAALLASSAATMSKESGVLGFVLIAGYLIWESGRFQFSLAPFLYRLYLLLAVALPISYLVALVAYGYGTRSLFYATPWEAPLRFLNHLGTLLATVWTNLFMPFPLDTLNFFPDLFPILFWVAAVPGWLLLIPVSRRVRAEWARLLPGMLWMLLTLIPQGVPPVSNRLFMLPLVGGATLLGVFLDRERSLRPTGRRKALLILVFALAVPVSALATLAQGLSLRSTAAMVREAAFEIANQVQTRSADVILLQSPSAITGFASFWTYYGETADFSKRFWLMQTGRQAVLWTRIDDNTYQLEGAGGDLLASPFEQLFRSSHPRVAPGLTFKGNFLSVQTLESGQRGVRRLQVRLARSLDDPEVVFLRAVGDRWKRIAPPAPGETVELPVPEVTNPFLP